MAVGDAHVFSGFLTLVLTQLFFPKPPTTFLTCFCRGERRKYAGKKSRLNWGSNLQSPGHESDTLTTELPSAISHRISKFQLDILNRSRNITKYQSFCMTGHRPQPGYNDTSTFSSKTVKITCICEALMPPKRPFLRIVTLIFDLDLSLTLVQAEGYG